MRRWWLERLFDGEDPSVDSLIVAAMVALVGLLWLSLLDISKGHEFSPIGYGTAAGAILGGLGGGKALRRIGAKRDADSSAAAG